MIISGPFGSFVKPLSKAARPHRRGSLCAREKGHGVAQDDQKAHWYRKAEEQGDEW